MCDDKDDDFIDDDFDDVDGSEDTALQDRNKNERRMDARRKLEKMRERQALKEQLGDDYYDFPLDDDL